MKTLFLIPSAYGMVTFAAAFALYEANLIGYVHTASDAYLLCMFAMVCFGCATAVGFREFSTRSGDLGAWLEGSPQKPQRANLILLIGMHLVGFYGIVKYIVALIGYFGSASELLLTLTTASYKVRQASDDVQNVGTQLSYVGWIAIWLTAFHAGRGRARAGLWVLAFLQFAANLIYIDRTRPVWLLFCGALMFVVARLHWISTTKLIRGAAVSGIGLVLTFVLAGAWIGKITLETGRTSARSMLPIAAEPVYLYATSGYAYLDQIVAEERPDNGMPRRLLYPAMIVASRLGLGEGPPPQINEFKNVPMPTNVGTFLEPMYRDAGVLGVIAGTLAVTFGGNAVALYLLRRPNPVGLVAWATLCFVNFIAFFTPKASSTPTWLIVALGLVATGWIAQAQVDRRRPSAVEPTREGELRSSG